MKSSIRVVLLTSLCAGILTASACYKAPGAKPAVSEADAAAAADATQAAWVTMDVAKIEAPYARDVVAFDPVDPPMSTTWENWDRLQKGFAAMKVDKMSVPDRKIQILDADNFIVSGTADFTSTDGPMKLGSMRFTDVYHRQSDGKWQIVNEHVSMKPEAPKPA
jgi:ketosteroid isomerase-like protein